MATEKKIESGNLCGGEGVDDLEDEFNWGEVHKRLLAYTVRKLGRQPFADAEELVQEALRQFFDSEYYDWARVDGDGLDELLMDLGSRVNGLLSNYWKKRKRRGVSVPIDCDHKAEGVSPEDRATNANEVTHAVNILLDRVADDEMAVEVLLKMAEGFRHAGDIAEALGVEAKEVYNARRRLRPHIDAVEAELEGSGT